MIRAFLIHLEISFISIFNEFGIRPKPLGQKEQIRGFCQSVPFQTFLTGFNPFREVTVTLVQYSTSKIE